MSDFILNRISHSGSSASASAAAGSSLQGDATSAETGFNRPYETEYLLDSKSLALSPTPLALVGWTLGEIQPLSGTHPLPNALNGNFPVQVNGLWLFAFELEFDAQAGNNEILEVYVEMREGTGPGMFGSWTEIFQSRAKAVVRTSANPDVVEPGRGEFFLGRQRIENSGLAARTDDVRAATPATPNTPVIYPDEFRAMAQSSAAVTVDLLGRFRVSLARAAEYRN